MSILSNKCLSLFNDNVCEQMYDYVDRPLGYIEFQSSEYWHLNIFCRFCLANDDDDHALPPKPKDKIFGKLWGAAYKEKF